MRFRVGNTVCSAGSAGPAHVPRLRDSVALLVSVLRIRKLFALQGWRLGNCRAPLQLCPVLLVARQVLT